MSQLLASSNDYSNNEFSTSSDINCGDEKLIVASSSKKASKKRDRSPSNNPNDTSKKPSITVASGATTAPVATTTTTTVAIAATTSQTVTNGNVVLSNSQIQITAPAIANSQQQQAVTTASLTNKKEKQRPETWNKIEQQIFFNALRQNGKNFEAITQYFNTRQKRYKIDAVQRSKEQIRHFYYRTWHKIIKYITIPTDQSIRDIQVNCLIAFNALMNKSHRWNKKSALKLVELINYGWTTVREKGKITRLRMPICKLTKNISTNNVESSSVLPQLINVSLQPKNELAFCRVQKLAQNPYLLVDVQSTHTIKHLISYLENKWKDRRMQFFEKINIENEDEEKFLNPNHQQFILYPDESHDLSNLEIESNINLGATSSGGVLNGGEEQVDGDSEQQNQQQHLPSFNNKISLNLATNGQIVTTSEQNNVNTPATIKIRLKSSDENEAQKQQQINKKALNEQNVQQQQQLNETNLNDSQLLLEDDDLVLTSTEDETDKDEARVVHQTATTTVPAASSNKKISSEKQPKPVSSKKLSTQQSSNIYRTQLNMDQLKAGVTNKSDLTFIQLYLALNKPTVIKLKYEWQPLKATAPAIAEEPSTSVEQIDKQRFYINVLAKVAESYLFEMKMKQQDGPNNSSELRAKKPPVVVFNEKLAQKPVTNEIVIATVANTEEASKTQKILQDMSSKARKLRQRKAIVVKSTRNSCESPTQFTNTAMMSPSSMVTSSSTASSSNNNIVLSAPVAAVARQIVNTTPNALTLNENTCFLPSTQRKASLAVPSGSSYPNGISQFNNTDHHNSNQLQQQQQYLTMQQNYSNIIPQILTTFLNNNESGITSNGDYNNSSSSTNDNIHSLNNVIMHSNMILSDEQNLMTHQQQQQQLSASNVDLSLIDLSLNNDSVFCLSENSNMSSLSNLLGSLQCKSLTNGPISSSAQGATNHHNLMTAISSSTVEAHTFIMPSTSATTTSTTLNLVQHYNHQNNYQPQQQQHHNSNNKLQTSGSGSFKRSDTFEWNDGLSDISLTSFLNEMPSPEKRQLLNMINENSRDSLFLNMDSMMERYEDPNQSLTTITTVSSSASTTAAATSTASSLYTTKN